jgi:uncharacterized RDD family membrane protein YckC
MPCLNHPEIVTGLQTCARCGGQFCENCIITLRGEPICADCKNESVRDIKSGVDNDDLVLASRGARLGAQFVDGLVFAPIWIGLSYAFGMFDAEQAPTLKLFDPKAAMLGVLLSILVAIYTFLMLKARGQTLGKMAANVKVVSADGEDMDTQQVAKRVGFNFVFGLIGVIPVIGALPMVIDSFFIFSDDRTTLHDRFAGTRVVKSKG